jgi:HEAT repeat protein
MDKLVKESFENLGSSDDKIRLNALKTILGITEKKVDWIYEVWDGLVDKLDDENSYQRSIAIMVLCNLAKSDSENRLAVSLQRLLGHTSDEKFITSRQCLQNIWKLAATSSRTREIVLDHLEKQFEGCAEEKHYNLLRQDIIQALRLIYDMGKDDSILVRAKELAKIEHEDKYRKKYEAILKTN